MFIHKTKYYTKIADRFFQPFDGNREHGSK